MADALHTRTTVQALLSVDSSSAANSAVDQPMIVSQPSDSQLAGGPAASDCLMPAISLLKRKRGRPPRNSGGLSPASPVAPVVKRSKKEEEDVCFICFDGGSLVLCDRRDCPKAYHPTCIKRDESFFRPNIRWNCGWHLCNTCQRNALFMCYTCPYSLCKGCVKHADIFCVRGNKGFCKNCMTTIMLIENIPQENKEVVQVDFDDATSWEYLFKVYWVLLKQKELFTSDELIRATNPWKVSGLDHKDRYPQKIQDTCVSKASELTCSDMHLEANGAKRRKTCKQALSPNNLDVQKVDKANEEKVSSLQSRLDWASNELLEFIGHMKNGDTSTLSQFDVQALLLDYIRTNNLRDPRQKCQIICDGRLLNLFGKSRVGHFEMLKLLEYHFREESCSNGMIRGAAIDPFAGQVEGVGINRDIKNPNTEMKRQTRRCDDRGRQSNADDDYAAINFHNISLIYLKRTLLENLMLDAETFHDKVVGSIVKIRISSNDRKQDMHRLVRIIGTTKAIEPYKIGNKTENIMLRILNLNNIEDVMLDAISDQEFSEDECRRLRQSIKLGLVERMTVGDIQKKATALQTVRVDDWLKTELKRLTHLQDRASELGHRKKHRECVEKIELLKTPEERQRRICEIPEVHADPRMDPSYGSDDDSGESDTKKRDGSVTHKYSKSNSKVAESISLAKGGDISKHDKAKLLKPSVNGERKRKLFAKIHVGRVEGATKHLGSPQKPEKVDVALRATEELSIRADSGVSSSDQGVVKIESISQEAHSSKPSLSSRKVPVSDITEYEKTWLYQDPSGKVQGPFCLLQLRKWNSSGFFPADLRVWRINATQDQSVLLNDALRKQHSHELHDGAKPDGGKDSSSPVPQQNIRALPHLGCEPNEEGSRSNLTSGADTSDGIEQCRSNQISTQISGNQGSDKSSEQNVETHLMKTETPHMAHKTECSDLSSLPARSDNVDMNSHLVNNESPSQGVGAPDSAVVSLVATDGINTSDFPNSMPKPESNDLKGLNMEENNHLVTSDTCKDLGVSHGNGSSAVSPTKMGNKEHDSEVEHSAASVEHHSGIDGEFCGNADISVPSLDASTVNNENLKPHDAESRNIFSPNSPNKVSDSSCSVNEDLKRHEAENRHYVSSNIPGQGSAGTSWSTMSVEMVFSDLFGASSMPENEALKTSGVESIHCDASNIPSQHSGASWSTISGEIEFADLPTTSIVENKHCRDPNIPVQNSCITWSTASSLVGEVNLDDLPGDWGAFPSVHAKSSIEGFNFLSCSSAKLADIAGDHPTPTSNNRHAGCDALDWQPIELSTLGDESVSDLLSEVEAMESLRGMSSPYSRMNGDDSIDSPGGDCFSPLGGLSPHIDPGKNDALSSTADIQFHIHNNPVDRQPMAFQIDVNDLPRTSSILSNTSPEIEEVKPAAVSLPNHVLVSEAPSPLLPPPHPPTPPPPQPSPPPSLPSLNVEVPSSPVEEGEVDRINDSVLHPEAGPKKQPLPLAAEMASLRDPPSQEIVKTSSSGSILENPNLHWSNSSQGMVTTSMNVHRSPSLGNQSTRMSQTSPRYNHSMGRHPVPKDRNHHHHGVDSGFGKGRPTSWSRQLSGSGGGGLSRPPHRGQRVCKFYESGYCKRGASCKYLHP